MGFLLESLEARARLEADAAAVKAQAATREATRAAQQAVEAAQARRRDDPGRYYGLQHEGGRVTYAELPLTPEGKDLPDRPRRLTIEDVNVEHVSTDADGVWIYRKM